jgi:hypothetical protein
MSRLVPNVWLTMDDLVREGACLQARDWFAEHYPNGTPITRAFLDSVPHTEWVEWLGVVLDPAWLLSWDIYRRSANIEAVLLLCYGEVDRR